MKNKLFPLVVFAIGAGLLTGCKGKKDAVSTPENRGEREVVEYCFGDDYISDDDHFRASATGTSERREVARSIARTLAASDLAASLKTVVEVVAENQATQMGFGSNDEVTTVFNELTRSIVNEALVGNKPICEKLTVSADGNKFTAYLALELSGADIANRYVEGLKNEERIRADYNYDQFKQTFDEVMSTYRKQ